MCVFFCGELLFGLTLLIWFEHYPCRHVSKWPDHQPIYVSPDSNSPEKAHWRNTSSGRWLTRSARHSCGSKIMILIVVDCEYFLIYLAKATWGFFVSRSRGIVQYSTNGIMGHMIRSKYQYWNIYCLIDTSPVAAGEIPVQETIDFENMNICAC